MNDQLTRKSRDLPWFVVALALATGFAAWGGCQGQPQSGATADAPQGVAKVGGTAGMVERGRYLVTIAGCNDCHTPWKMGERGPEPDMTRMLSGHPEGVEMPETPPLEMPWGWVGSADMTAFRGPWGTTFTPNLTSDEETGVGAWTEEMFIGAIRNGKIHGVGRPIMPPMPWPNYAQMTDDDLKAVFAYLKSTPPIRNRVPDYQPPEGGGEEARP